MSTQRLFPKGLLPLAAIGLLAAAPGAPAAPPPVSFQGPTSFAAGGEGPLSVAVGDFNGDSDPDLAVVNQGSDHVAVLLGGARGSFGAATPFATGDAPQSVAVGDFNADSDPDLAVANFGSDHVSVLLGGAGASFGPAAAIAVGDSQRSVAVGDFNGDTDPDLVVANASSDDVSVLLGGAGGSFGPAAPVAVGDDPEDIAVGDFNADSDPDLAVTTPGGDDLVILLGGAGGSFGAAGSVAVGNAPRSVAVGDFNADSDPDLATPNGASSDVSVLLGGAGATFGAAAPAFVDIDPEHAAVGDFNADSDPDLAIPHVRPGTVTVLLGDAGAAFVELPGFDAGDFPRWVAIGDFNADAAPDLAVANQASNDVSVLLNSLHAPPPPTLTDSDPDSPANETSPRLKGQAEPGSTVRVYASPDCSGPPAATGSPADFASPGFQVSVADDTTTTFTATVTNPADVASECSSALTYVEDSTAPEPPMLRDSDPDSPVNDNSPRLKGEAEAGSTVSLYSSEDCSGTAAATGSAAEFTSPGLAVSVADDSSTSFWTRATDQAGNASPCSTGSLAYVEDTAPPTASLTLAPNPVLTGTTVGFDASASFDQPGGTIARYEWDLDGDGSFETDTGADPTASRSYSAAAEIDPAVRVTSSLGQSQVASRPLSVRTPPPPGALGVSIDGGARFTNSPRVTVHVVWPRFAADMRLSNDGGFGNAQTFPVAESTSWLLDPSGPERLPRTVYVRFAGGESGGETYSDDIILDETVPTLQSATFAGANRIRIRARDRTAGIAGYQATTRRRRPGRLRRFAKPRHRVRRTITVRARSPRLYVRVRDAAGNNSRWRRVER